MGDRLRQPHPQQVITASSRILAPTLHDEPRAEHWHEEAWAMRNTTGELRFAELWLANTLSQAKLIAARRPAPGADPEPVETGLAADLVAALAGGPGGQAALLRAFATQLMTPGVAYLLGQPGIDNASSWSVTSSDQIRLSPRRDDETNLQLYELREGEEASDWRVLQAGSLPVKVFRPDPRFNWRPDSPVRGALPILRELSLLTQHVEAQATSRLAGAGVLAMDSNLEMPGGWEAWLREFLSTINTPIKNRSVPAAYAPFPMKIPLKPGEKIQDKLVHLMFATPFDEQSLHLREEAIERVATAMDLPAKMLTGESENHWGKWHTEEEGLKVHVVPDLDIICEGITRGYFTPGMQAGEAPDPVELGNVIQLRDAQPPPMQDGSEVFVWYDVSALGQRPDRSEHAKDAYDRHEIDSDAYRRETGLSDAGPPTQQELERQVWLSLVNTELGPLALLKLGMATEDDLKIVGTAADGAVGQPPLPQPVDDEVEPPADGPPATREDDEPDDTGAPGQQQPQAAGLVPVALVAACDGLVFRALERAGNRLRQAMRRTTAGAPDCSAVVAHTCCNAARVQPVDRLLDGAWDRVPDVAAMLGEPADVLADALDAYVRQLIRTRTAHTWELLADHLGVEHATEAA